MASTKPCNPCHVQNKTVNGITWCSDCEEYLCAECTSHHKSLGITRTHNLIDVEGLQQLPSGLSKLHCCAQHGELQVEYFCSFHDSTCCHACLAEGHKSCDSVVALDLVCKNSKTSILLDFERELKHITETLDVLNAALETDSNSFENQYREMRKNVVTAKTRAIEQLNKHQETLIIQLEDEKRKVEGDTDKIKQQTKDLELNISARLQQIQFVQEHGTTKQAFLLNHVLREFIQNSEKSTSVILQNFIPSKLEENMDSTKTVTSLGSLKITSQPTDIQHTTAKGIHAQSAAQVNVPLSSFKVSSTFKTDDRDNVLGMICTDDNRLLLCNFTRDNAINMYSEDGRLIQIITMEHEPYDIAEVPGRGQYVVILPYIYSIQCIDKISLKPGKVMKIETEKKIYGIAASEQIIYAGGYNEILALDMKGSAIRRIPFPDMKCILYLSFQNNALYATSMTRKVIKISYDLPHSIKQIYTDGPNTLRKIITDRHGYVYVGGQESGKIYRMTKDLERDMEITNDTFKEIGAICFNKDCSRLFVSNDRGKTVVVLKCL